jgi:CheY-like chemotaxis protein
MTSKPPRQILLAEDSSSQRKLLKALCQQIPNAVVHEAADGSWAFQLSRQIPKLDLVITDLNMPGMDGIELVEHLSRQPHIRPAADQRPLAGIAGQQRARRSGAGLYRHRPSGQTD